MSKESKKVKFKSDDKTTTNEQRQLALELHAPSRRRFQRRRVVTTHMSDLYEVDLVEMQTLSRYNHGFRYYLALINTFTKMGYTAALKSKKGSEVALAFDKLVTENKLTMDNLSSDKGTEFFNSNFKSVMKKHNINHYHTFTEIKCSIVERWNRTIKSNLFRLFTERNTLNWVDGLLDEVVKEYNHSKHRTIAMRPVDVTKKTEDLVRQRLAVSKTPIKKPKFKVGDYVRISRWQRNIFSKTYLGSWSEELFLIRQIKNTVPITYLLEDSHGKSLPESFYEIELKATEIKDYFRIDKVIGKRVNKDGSIDLKVTKKGYDKKYYYWIPETETKNL